MTLTGEELAAALDALVDEPLEPTYNAGPTQRLPILGVRAGERHVRLARWGLVPYWSKGPGAGPPMFNARSETARSNGAFRTPFAKRRCVVPLSGFFEWRKLEGGKKQPLFFHAPDERLLLAAGLWDLWRGPDGDLRSFTVLTCPPNALVAPIHDRMPVLLDAEGARRWLEPDASLDALQALCAPCPADALAAHEVSPRVGSLRVNEPDLLRRVA